MKRKLTARTASSQAALLLVGAASPQTARIVALLEQSGFTVTHAEDICRAEILAELQYFDAAVYDASLPPHEQISLARIMRLRWPWMRLISCGVRPALADPSLFDTCSTSEQNLPLDIRGVLLA